jgi:hypothetical protein
MLGLYSPMLANANTITNNTLIVGARPTVTSTDRIEAALNRLLEDQRREQQGAPVVDAAAEPTEAPSTELPGRC